MYVPSRMTMLGGMAQKFNDSYLSEISRPDLTDAGGAGGDRRSPGPKSAGMIRTTSVRFLVAFCGPVPRSLR